MKDFRKRKGLWILLAAVILSVGIFALSFYTAGRAGPFANAINILSAPLRSGMSGISIWVEERYAYAYTYDALLEENEQLKARIAALEEQARTGEAASRENERLYQLLGLREKRRDFVFESAMVVARAASNWEATITLSKGESHGIAAGDCVVDPNGILVGVVSKTGLNWCTVSLITDSSIEIGGKLARNDVAAILEGDFALMTEAKLKLSFLPEDTDLLAGDQVVTSGRGGVYPSDLVVGHVESVRTEPDGVSRYAVVIPAVTFSELKQVFVITDFDINE